MKTKTGLINSIVIFAAISATAYVVVRTSLFLFADYTLIEKTFAATLIIAEFFVILHGLGYIFNIFESSKAKESPLPSGLLSGEEPLVAVLVAARHEPKEVLKNTFLTINALDYKDKQVFLLDDSSDEKYIREADELSREMGLTLFRRRERHGAKAGIVNDCLKGLKHKYVVLFDADQNPMPDFLKRIVPLMEKDNKLAFIQTPQFYSNLESSRVARGAAFQQAVFYEYICEGKSTDGAMFCCGTNIIFRKQALVEVGGLDESTVTEDFATSIKIHARKWRSLYYNHVDAFGMAPENLGDYFKQQFRWATGTISVFKKLLFRFFTRPFSLNTMQWWEYMLSSTYYMIGLAFFVLMACPICYLMFRVPSFFARPEIYFLAFMPYIILSMSVFYSILKTRNYKVRDLFAGQLLGMITFSVYIRSALTALSGIKISFGVTGKSKASAVPYIRLWPQISMVLINFIAVVWGINRFIYEREPAILINSFWGIYHFIVLSSVFYFNQEQA